MSDIRISTRAKLMIMGDLNMGQYLFKNTNTMLPRKHQECMSDLLNLFAKGIIITDIFSGGERASITFLAPISSLSKWIPEQAKIIVQATETEPTHIEDNKNEYVLQTAVLGKDSIITECISRKSINAETWVFGPKRTHSMDEYPKNYSARLSSLSGSAEAYGLIWKTMALICIWERNPGDDLKSLIAHIESL